MAVCPLPIRARLPLAASVLLLVLLVSLFVRVRVSGHFNGLFLLSGRGRHVVEVKDDLYLGEGSRLLLAVDFGPAKRRYHEWRSGGKEPTGLSLVWNEGEGSGYVKQTFPDGSVLVTNFSRFLDESGREVHGLLLGGGLPEAVREGGAARKSDTGMTWFHGNRWYHVWCNMNEAVHATRELDPARFSYPSDWRFLGSAVLRDGPRKVVLSSSHGTAVEGVPLRIDRYAYFNAGETFFRLSIRIRNEGDRPVEITYDYGDEPWVGNYGSSTGNVGWVEGGLVERVGIVDTSRYRYAGFWDRGSDLSDPIGRAYTGVANFIEWLGPNGPDTVYFSNVAGFSEEDAMAAAPLMGDSRFLGLAWGPRRLAPGEESVIYLAQGLAPPDPRTGIPVKPPVPLRAPLD